jgi:hypothetical protein
MRRSRSRVGWWLFSARLFSRAAALTNTCFTSQVPGSRLLPPDNCATGR